MLSRLFTRKSNQITQQAFRTFSAGDSLWKSISQAPADPIMGLNVSYQADKNTNKQNLGIGAYRDDNGKPVVLQCVKTASERILAGGFDHEYSGIDGNPSYRKRSAILAFGEDHDVIKTNRVGSCQTISGTGSLRIGMDFLKEWFPNKDAKIFVPEPTWPTHRGIAEKSGF